MLIFRTGEKKRIGMIVEPDPMIQQTADSSLFKHRTKLIFFLFKTRGHYPGCCVENSSIIFGSIDSNLDELFVFGIPQSRLN